jgi:DeoR family transcriptional regulator of aga operon
MIEIAAEVILAVDSSKFGKRSMGVISQISAIDTIITDKKIHKDDFNKLSDLGIQIILA